MPQQCWRNHDLLVQPPIVHAAVHKALMEAGTSPLMEVGRWEIVKAEAKPCHGAGERSGGKCRRDVFKSRKVLNDMTSSIEEG